MSGFQGTYHQKVDDKGRFSIPKDLRLILEKADPEHAPGGPCRVSFVHGKHLDQMLEGYTMTEFQAVSDRISGMKRTNPKRKLMQEVVIRSSLVIEVDPNGRAILPKLLREKLGAEGGAELVFGGMWDHFTVRIAEVQETKVEAEVDRMLEDLGGPGVDIMAFLDEED